jgi:ABC-2 type transport system permease protein
MKSKLIHNLYLAWTIASKDIVDALMDKAIRTNILVMIGLVMFFSWYSNVRPWDKRIDTVVFDEGSTNLDLDTHELADGYSVRFYKASSRPEMERTMANKGMGLVVGLVLPADFDGFLNADGELTLDGYILWVKRRKVDELEALYSGKFSELLGRQVHVEIGGNIVTPPPNAQSTSTNFTLLFAIFWTAIMIVPHLMLEEMRTKTLDALLVSPVSSGQVVIGKALAGLFYVGLIAGLSIATNWAYISEWGIIIVAFLVTMLFAIGSGLSLGSFLSSSQQLNLWGLVINFFLMVPALIVLDPLLVENVRVALSWLPTAAMVKLFQFSFSNGITPSQLWTNLAIALVWTGLVYALLFWKVRQTDS